MRQIAPEAPVYQAGSLSGNPVAMAAGLATLRETERPGFYETLERRTGRLVAGVMGAPRGAAGPAPPGETGAVGGGCFSPPPPPGFLPRRTPRPRRVAAPA